MSVYLRPFLVAAAGAALGTLLLRVLPWWTGCAVLAAAALASLPEVLEALSLRCDLTNMRLALQCGWLGRRTAETTLDKVGSIVVEQSLLGRLLGYGDVTLMIAGGRTETLRRLSSPREFQRKAMARILAAKARSESKPPLDELQGRRELSPRKQGILIPA